MKKLLLVLLFPLTGFGQSYLDYSKVNEVTQVGDTLTVKFQYFKNPNLGDATLTQYDFQYNNKLLAYLSHDWMVASSSAQKARNSWNGYKFSIDASKGVTDFDGQYLSWLGGAATYAQDADWTVERVTVQDATGYPSEAEFVKYKFKIKDKASSTYSDYSNLINANWANFKEADGTLIDMTVGSSGHNLSLASIQGGDAGNVTLNVFSNIITNNIGTGSDFTYTIYTKADAEAGINQNTPVIANGAFDNSGQATITGLVNDTEYSVIISIIGQKEYLNEAVTVSDLALIFQEAIGAGSSPNGTNTTFDYAIQKILGNVISPTGVDFQDSYEVLAYLQGTNSGNTPWITKTGQAFNLSGVKSTFGDKNANGSATFSSVITPTDINKSFDFAHALNGDVNFSHSFQPTSVNAVMNTQASKVTLMSSAKYVPLNAALDLLSELKDGKVIFTIKSQVEGMVGSQFNIEYDNTRLQLEDVIFDTGNSMTNFSNHISSEGKIRVGSFDQNLNTTVKVGTPYKLIFKPLVQLTNTAGLVTFKVKEGVKADGTQIKFQIN